MKHTHILIKFGEIFLKGKNRNFFIKILFENIKKVLEDIKNLDYNVFFDHLEIILNNNNEEKIVNLLSNISGIYSISLVNEVNLEMEEIIKKAISIVKENNDDKTFKIFCKRTNKKFYLKSSDIIREVAKKILEKTNFSVDVHNPNLKIFIEIHNKNSFLFTNKDIFYGVGGLPLRTSGKVLMLISGGIDSPVASYMLMNRGIELDFIHFASPPYTSEAVIDKIKDILKVLNEKKLYKSKLYIVPFTEIQTTIYKLEDVSYAITLLRRFMYRIANKIATKFNYLAIASGDSIGQVSSQTLESINVIENFSDVNKVPLLRPLCAFDKIDIIKIAKKIKTFDISNRPFEDCCTVFSTKKVKTKPNLEKVILLEKNINFSLIEKAIEKIKIINHNSLDS